MRKKLGLLLVAVAAVSGCTMAPEKQQGMLIGASAGALFSGAAACGTAAAIDSKNTNALAIACPIGILGGAIIGGTIGYLAAQKVPPPEAPPPPPPPPPLQQPAAPPLASPPPTATPASTPTPLPPPPSPTVMPPSPSLTMAPSPSPSPSPSPTLTPSPSPSPSPAPPPPPSPPSPSPTLPPPPLPVTPAPTPPPPPAPTPTLAPPPPMRAPVPPPPPPPPAAAATEERLVLRGVHFQAGSSDLSETEQPILDEAAETLKAHPNARIYVKGYCDAAGSPEKNMKLSQERAATVAAYLQSKGVPLTQLIVVGMGGTHFIATNDTVKGRARNRRVELEPVVE